MYHCLKSVKYSIIMEVISIQQFMSILDTVRKIYAHRLKDPVKTPTQDVAVNLLNLLSYSTYAIMRSLNFIAMLLPAVAVSRAI